MRQNRVITSFLLVIFAAGSVSGTTSYSLEEALKRKLVKAEISGRGSTPENYSSHHGKCIRITLHNLTSQSLNVNIEQGRNLRCIYDSVQNMLVASGEMMALSPSQKKEFTIFAFCSEKTDKSPSESSRFELASMAEGSMVQLIRIIERYKAFNGTGQAAVWVLTDDASPDAITGSDPETVKALKEYVTNLKNAKPEEGYIYDYSFTAFNNPPSTIQGEIGWELESGGWVSLSLYDNNNTKIHQFFSDVAYQRGYHSYKYKLTHQALISGQRYWVRLFVNNKKFKELSVVMD
jgi:hypothetical protein